MILAAVTCTRNQDRRYQTSSRVESPSTPESRKTIRGTPSMIKVSPNNSLNKPNGELQAARNEDAWHETKLNLTPERIVTAKEFTESIDRLCFILFFLVWLIVTVVYMTVLSR